MLMALSPYDKTHVGNILAGEGTWFEARLLRALDALLCHADLGNERLLRTTWPEECAALDAFNNPPSEEA
jgi:hypothetical protein